VSEHRHIIAGTWDVTIATPIGIIAVVLDLTENNGSITGNARGDSETVPLMGATLTGNRLTWKQAIRKPIRLNLSFDVTVDGETLTGVSRAGMLPGFSRCRYAEKVTFRAANQRCKKTLQPECARRDIFRTSRTGSLPANSRGGGLSSIDRPQLKGRLVNIELPAQPASGGEGLEYLAASLQEFLLHLPHSDGREILAASARRRQSLGGQSRLARRRAPAC